VTVVTFRAAPRVLLFPLRRRTTKRGECEIADLRVNGYIRAPEVRVVAPDGSQIGVKKLSEALWLAEQLELDLVEVAPTAKPPVCKIMDYGKYKYELSVRDREARKKQTRTVIKETRLTPRIADHDFQMQARRTAEWLAGGDKVKVTVRFRGRERERPEFGRDVLDRLVEAIGERGIVEQPASLEGRNMTMTIAPNRKFREPGPVGDGEEHSDEEE
jgi:translation initiation factor IF-3